MAAAGGDGRIGFVLGLDLGTSSVKAVLLEAGPRGRLLVPTASASRATRADVSPSREAGPRGQEQDVGRILQALSECLGTLPAGQLQKVQGISVSGQMHGVMFWKSCQACSWMESGAYGVFEPQQVSRLITWQDGRCTNSFLASLPQPESHLSVATGFGSATIYWLLHHSPEFLKPYNAAGTVQDYVVAMLCGLQRPLMSDHNAASWGYFNTESRSWNSHILEESGFPTHLLPDVAEAGTIAGQTTHQWFGIPQGTEVGVALGDLQCSVYSCMSRSTDADFCGKVRLLPGSMRAAVPRWDFSSLFLLDKADPASDPAYAHSHPPTSKPTPTSMEHATALRVLNISTSVQLAASMPPGFKPATCPDPSDPVAYFPYFNRTYLGVAASLNGGNVLATFVTMLTQWMADLGLDVLETLIYSQMIQTALAQTDTQLTINPILLGERHLPEELASVSSISPSDLSLGHVTRALCRGIVQNIHAMLPYEQLKEWGIERIIGSGSALSRNEVLRQEVEKAFPFPVSYGQDVDAAAGAALVMLQESSRGAAGGHQKPCFS